MLELKLGRSFRDSFEGENRKVFVAFNSPVDDMDEGVGGWVLDETRP